MFTMFRLCTAFLLVTSTLLAGCSGTASESYPRTVKIGVVGPFEGPNAHIGTMIMNSVRLYFEQHPIDSLTVQLVPIDTKSNPASAVSALQSSVSDSGLAALIAFYHSSTALAGKPIIQEAQLPTLIYSASNPAVTDSAPYYFRLVPTDDNQAVVLSDFARTMGARSIGILYYADEYGRGLSDGIQGRARQAGIPVVAVQSYDESTTDFRPVLTVLDRRNPDVILICGFVEKSIAILNQAAERGVRATFLAGDGTFNEEQLVQGAGSNAEGVYVAAPYVFDDTNQKNRQFLEAYWKEYDGDGARQKPAPWTAYAYDAAAILDRALRSGNRDRSSIYRYLQSMRNPANAYEGITGRIYFDASGNAVGRQFGLAVVRQGRFTSADAEAPTGATSSDEAPATTAAAGTAAGTR